MGRLIDLTGKKFGRWTVLSYEGRVFWKCQCSCGTIKIVRGQGIREGRTTSCGCYNLKIVTGKKSPRLIDLVGKKFGSLTVLARDGRNQWGNTTWRCRCICGKEIVTTRSKLRDRPNISCGCVRVKNLILRMETHGMSKTRLYKIWCHLLDRCNNKKVPSYKRYGGRGIHCLWKNFNEFVKDMFPSYLDHAKKHGEFDTTIDRIDNDGNYCKENCRWATRKVQTNNQSRNILITFQGRTQTLAQWSDELKIPYFRLMARIKSPKWSIEKAFTAEIQKSIPIEFDGKKMSLSAWAKELNLPYSLLAQRIRSRKWSVEKTFTTPRLINQFI